MTNGDLQMALEHHLQPVKDELVSIKQAITRLNETVHDGDKGRNIAPLTRRFNELELRVEKMEEKDARRVAYVAGAAATLTVILTLLSVIGFQALSKINAVLEALQ